VAQSVASLALVFSFDFLVVLGKESESEVIFSRSVKVLTISGKILVKLG